MLLHFLLLGADAETVGTPAPVDPSSAGGDWDGVPEWMLDAEEPSVWEYTGPEDDVIAADWETARVAYEACLAADEAECEILGMDLDDNAFHQAWTAATEAIAVAAGELSILNLNRLTADLLHQPAADFDPVAYVKAAAKFLESGEQEHVIASARFTVAPAPSKDVVGSHQRRLLACYACWPWELHLRGCWCDCDNKGNLHQGCSAFCPCRGGYSCQPGIHKCYHYPRRINEPCVAGHGCKSGLTCEAGSHRCRAPGNVGDGCHMTRPCRSGLSCQPGVHKCYHVPRRENEPCSAGFGCGSPLTCEAGSQRCKRPGEVNDPCHATRPCKAGLNCEAGSHRCKRPGEVNDPCHMTRPCKSGLTCEAGKHVCRAPGDVGTHCHLTRPCKSHLHCQHLIDIGSNFCRDPNGANEGQRCMFDDHCKGHLWCKGGSILRMGFCSKCPEWCGMGGCHQCSDDEEAVSCGKLDNVGDEIGCALSFAASQTVNFLKCMFEGNVLMECGLDIAAQATKCISNPDHGPNCDFALGDCATIAYDASYEKEWSGSATKSFGGSGIKKKSKNGRRRLVSIREPLDDYLRHGDIIRVDRSLAAPEDAFRRLEVSADATFKVGGGVSGEVKPVLTVNPVKGRATVGINFEGTIDGYLEMEFNAAASAEVDQPLSPPRTIFRKFFMAGYVPVLIELKAQPYFWGTADAGATITAALNLQHTIEANFEVELDISKNSAEGPTGGGTIHPVTMSLVADGSAEIEVTGYVGMRFSLEVNKVGVDVDVAAGVEGSANLEASMETGAEIDLTALQNAQPTFGDVDICVQGSAEFKTGIAYRSSVGFKIPNPKEAVMMGCHAGMSLVDANVPLKGVDCAIEAYIDDSVDLTDKVKGLCDEIEKNIPSELDWDTSGLPTEVTSEWELIELWAGNFEVNMVESGAGCDDEDDDGEGSSEGSPYPDVKYVSLNAKPNDKGWTSIQDIAAKCGQGWDLVSLQDADHAIWLRDFVQQQGVNLREGAGVPLGFDYKHENKYADLTNPSRSVQHIYDELRTKGWSGDYRSKQVRKGSSCSQQFSGMGWGKSEENVGIEDWGNCHRLQGVICERSQFPDIEIVNGQNKKLALSDVKDRCKDGYQLVDVKSVRHVYWLQRQLQIAGYNLRKASGVPLGYDYDLKNKYSSLIDRSKSLDHIFGVLRQSGFTGDFKSDQTSQKQHFAGFGWGASDFDVGIEDWAANHATNAIICEKM